MPAIFYLTSTLSKPKTLETYHTHQLLFSTIATDCHIFSVDQTWKCRGKINLQTTECVHFYRLAFQHITIFYITAIDKIQYNLDIVNTKMFPSNEYIHNSDTEHSALFNDDHVTVKHPLHVIYPHRSWYIFTSYALCWQLFIIFLVVEQ